VLAVFVGADLAADGLGTRRPTPAGADGAW
jgi:hypothetical protein